MDQSTTRTRVHIPHSAPAPRERDTWYYPPEIAEDLKDVDLADEVKAEILATAWEYTRCVIPHYTNRGRYIAFVRTIAVAVGAEFKGSLVDVMAGGNILGYSIEGILAALFEGTSNHAYCAREYRGALLIMGEKASNRRDGELFRQYVNSLVQSPRNWFRMRDCDSLARYTMAAALACNDLDDVWFSEEQFTILSEMALTMYDAVAFYKHRSEGEIHNTFAYMSEDLRVKAFRQCREVLWALDATSAGQTEMLIAVNFVRIFGGALHMLTRRYRFVDEGLTIGKPETEHVIMQTRANVKLWHRIEANERKDVSEASVQRYRDALARSDELMFPGLAEIIETAGNGRCETCLYRVSYGAVATYCFGGVQLCDGCRSEWRDYLESFPERASQAFPELVNAYSRAITSTGRNTSGEGYT